MLAGQQKALAMEGLGGGDGGLVSGAQAWAVASGNASPVVMAGALKGRDTARFLGHPDRHAFTVAHVYGVYIGLIAFVIVARNGKAGEAQKADSNGG